MRRFLVGLGVLAVLLLHVERSAEAQSGSTKAQQEYSKALTANTFFGVPRYTTAALPVCNTNNRGALAFDTTLGSLVVCTGTAYAASGGSSGSFATSVTVGTATTAGNAICSIDSTMGGASATDNFENCTGTMPTVLTATGSAALFSFTGAGSSNQQNSVLKAIYNAGYTGVNTSAAVIGTNANAGSPDWINSDTIAAGLLGQTTGAATVAAGVYGRSDNATNSLGVLGHTNSGSAHRAGVLGNANSTGATTYIGGMFTLGGTMLPSSISGAVSALVASNGAVAGNIFEARDNGTAVGIVQDAGSTWEKIGTKNLTLGGGAVVFVKVAVTSGAYQGGEIHYCADASDATDFQERCGVIPIALVNKAGTATCGVPTPTTATESVAASAGTFTVAFTAANNAGACDFSANGTSSLTETVMRINYHVRLYGNGVNAVTAQ